MKCFVPSCGVDFHKRLKFRGHSISKHSFPQNKARRLQWLQSIAAAEKGNFDYDSVNFKSVRMCSLHFDGSCFTSASYRIRLTDEAVPSIFGPAVFAASRQQYIATVRQIQKKVNGAGQSQLTLKSNKSMQTGDFGLHPGPPPIPADKSEFCRLCFTTAHLEPLCSGTIVVRNELLDKIYICTGILIIPKPRKSAFICQPCAKTINNFHAYRQQICSNNRALVTYQARKVQAEDLPNDYSQTKIPKPIKRPLARGTLPAKKRKIQTQLPIAEEESCIDLPADIKLEPVDPLESHEEPHSNADELPIESTAGTQFVKFHPEGIQTITIDSEPSSYSFDLDDSPEMERWDCWHCGTRFAFKFECAKHLLQKHREDVPVIVMRLKLDELNRDMLEMMSVNNRTQLHHMGGKRKEE